MRHLFRAIFARLDNDNLIMREQAVPPRQKNHFLKLRTLQRAEKVIFDRHFAFQG
jgi:hypothetical protein